MGPTINMARLTGDWIINLSRGRRFLTNLLKYLAFLGESYCFGFPRLLPKTIFYHLLFAYTLFKNLGEMPYTEPFLFFLRR